MALSKERKDQIIKQFATHEGDTGSTQVQVAVLTADINELNEHLRTHKHDEEDWSPAEPLGLPAAH